MRTILHIGMSKTGTTALQETFARSREVLAAHGVLYPRNPPGGQQRNHQVIACGLARFERLPREFHSRYPDAASARAAFDDFAATLRARFAEARPEVLLLSGESMFRVFGPAAARRLVGLSADPDDGPGGHPGGEVRIAAYVRRPSEHFLSHIQQAMRFSHRPRPARSREILPVLDSYARFFGAEAIDARPFQREIMADGDVVSDFCARHLADRGVTRADLAVPKFVNESLSAEASDVSRRYRAEFHPGKDRFSPDSRVLLAELARIDSRLGATRPRLRPGLGEALDYASAEPLALRERYGIEFAGLDYGRLERGELTAPPAGRLDLDAILVIDPERRCAVFDALRRSPWAEASERRIWIERELGSLGSLQRAGA